MALSAGELEVRVGEDYSVFNQHSQKDNSIEWALVMSRVGHARILTHHPVQMHKGSPAIRPGVPVDKAVARELLEAFKDGSDATWIEPCMLFRSEHTLAWFSPAKVAPMHFAIGQSKLGLRVPWPQLVFIAHRDQGLQVFATCGQGRPERGTALHHAPIGNIHGDGQLCWGNITPPAFKASSIPEWEKAIYSTWFTHPNHDRFLRREKDDKTDGSGRLVRFWRELHQQKAKAFPERELVAVGKNLGAICGS